MLCQEVMELLMPYLDNELDDGQKADFEEHIEACETCRAELVLMKSILSESASIGMNPPKELRNSVNAKIRADKRKKLYEILSPVAVAAVLFVVIGLNFNTILSIFGKETDLNLVKGSASYEDASTGDAQADAKSGAENAPEVQASIQDNFAYDNGTSSAASRNSAVDKSAATAGSADMSAALPFGVTGRYALSSAATFRYGVLVPSSAAEILKNNSEFIVFAAGEPPLYASTLSLTELTERLKNLGVKTIIDQTEDTAVYSRLNKNAQYGFILIQQ